MITSPAFAALALGAIALTASLPAAANVVTFTDIPGTLIDTSIWVEDGITVNGSGSLLFGAFSIPDTLHLDGMSPYSSMVDLTMASVFDAHRIDMIPIGSDGGHSALCVGDVCGLPFMNVLFEGFSGLNLVAILGMWMGETPTTFFFPDTFAGLTRLRLSMLFNADCMDQPCTHMNIDNVTLLIDDALSAIPLPTALPLFASGIVALGAGGLWRRRSGPRRDR